MKRLAALAMVLAFFGAACGDDNNSPTTPSQPTQAVFTAQLSPANEVPPVTATGTGTMTMTMNMTRDSAGNITAATIDFNGTFSNFAAGTILTAAHIHPGAAGTNNNPIVPVPLSAGDVTFPNGSGTLVRTGVQVTPVDNATQILNNPAGFYFNIHTASNPGGIARGQLGRTQ